MNNKALKVFLEIGYIGVMGIFLILTSYHKLSSGHYIIMYFFNYYSFYVASLVPKENKVPGKLLVQQVEHYIDAQKRLEIAKKYNGIVI